MKSSRIIAAVAALTLVATACGDDDDTADTSGSPPATSANAVTETSAEGSDPETSDGAAPSGSSSGSLASASGEPFRIGFAHMSNTFPGFLQGAEVAAAYLNAAQGGIGGRPIEIVPCPANDDVEAEQCGQQFANDDDMPVVMMGNVFQSGPLYSAVVPTGRPIFGGIPVTPVDYDQPNTFFFNGGVPAALPGAATFARDGLGEVKTVAVIYIDAPSGQASFDELKRILEPAGIEVTGVAVNDATSSDITPQLAAAGADSADVIMPYLASERACIQAVKVLADYPSDAPRVSSGTCLAPGVRQEVGNEALEDWYLVTYQTPLDVPAGTDEEVDRLLANFETYGDGRDPLTQFANIGYRNLVTMHRALSGMTAADLADSEAIAEAFRTFTGPVEGMADEVQCPASPQYPTVCNLTVRVWQSQADGTSMPVEGELQEIDLATEVSG